MSAIPLILLIHFLQERSRKVRVSTLFLLDRVRPESVGGAKFERLRNSVPLWLQIIAALLLTWMLCEPRWIRNDSRQTMVIVLDSSVSMSAFKEKTRELLASKLRSWSRTSAATEWHLLESNPRKPTLYAGDDLSQVMTTFDQWEPTMSSHLPDDVLLTARSLVKGAGLVIFVTDHPAEVSSDIAVLSAGEAIENVGFAGVEVKRVSDDVSSGTKWRTLVKNYGKEKATRSWWVEQNVKGVGMKAGEKRQLTLEPGQTLALAGELPSDVEQAMLNLDGDRFSWDDRLPIQKPTQRIVNVHLQSEGETAQTLRKMFGALELVKFTNDKPDLVISELGTPVNTDAIQFATGSTEEGKLDGSWTVAENHSLTRDLNWMGLLTSKPGEFALTPEDEPLLWKGDRLLALIRNSVSEDGRKIRRLLLTWDLNTSNAPRHPAMLVMLHRFLEQIREGKKEPWSGNFETGQLLNLPQFTEMKLKVKDAQTSFDGRLPEQGSFFEVLAQNVVVIQGAAIFADTREADFLKAVPFDSAEERRWESALKQTEADPFAPLWLLLALACLVGAWAWKSPKHEPVSPLVP